MYATATSDIQVTNAGFMESTDEGTIEYRDSDVPGICVMTEHVTDDAGRILTGNHLAITVKTREARNPHVIRTSCPTQSGQLTVLQPLQDRLVIDLIRSSLQCVARNEPIEGEEWRIEHGMLTIKNTGEFAALNSIAVEASP